MKRNFDLKRKKISISFVRILLGFFAISFVGLVVLNWWWAYYHGGYVVISFIEFGEMPFEFFLIHFIFILVITLTFFVIRGEIR